MIIALAITVVASLAFAAYVVRSVNEERHAIRLERTALIAHHEQRIATILQDWRLEREEATREHRSDLRELLNRVQHPHLIPTHTAAPAAPRPQTNVSAKARAAFNGVGTVARPAPGNVLDDELEADIP